MEAASAGGSGGGDDHLHGLKFGKKIYFEDAGASGSGSSGGSASGGSEPPPPPSASPPRAAAGRRGRGAAGGAAGSSAPPRCQVEGCNVDLTGAKTYHCRHKVCAMHSKAPLVVVNGIEQRFCQQCSRLPAIALSSFSLLLLQQLQHFFRFILSWHFRAFALLPVFFFNSFRSLGLMETT